ncbi:PLP-dependent transferase [Aspergillus steynii IBT 23096]|uniref:glutamate decarboxylase n=1 Tax=Aspergillus steynii IBT 23096 TaxID=1392250 RepID=A0A2I2GF01_9EURO|nr:PLP-dependent transferase [Aspergillus steynii IBT 23096]PLB51452.1 PLP-dependent transferase [Aspergillus steynii IBT 23096]
MNQIKLPSETSDSASLILQSMKKEMGRDILPHRNLGRYRNKCISILADLWNKAENESPVGAATTGSSEAILLAGLAMKRAWQQKAPTDGKKPNVVVGSNAHACVFKFAAYFDVEARVISVNAASQFVVGKNQVAEVLDQDTVGVFLTLGSTYTGHFDPIMDVASELEIFERRTGHFIPIHIDAASGGFVAPFDPACEGLIYNRDFRIRQVQSINASGHKFGFSACTVGWLVWRDVSCVPDNLLVESSYLRGTQSAYTLSFSRSQAPVVVQYFNFLHLGVDGYQQKITALLSASRSFSHQLNTSRIFKCISPGHQPTSHLDNIQQHLSLCKYTDYSFETKQKDQCHPGLPVVVFTASKSAQGNIHPTQLSDLSNWMFEKGFSIPHYTLPKWGDQGQNMDVLRIVIREDVVPQLPLVYEMLMEGVQRLLKVSVE